MFLKRHILFLGKCPVRLVWMLMLGNVVGGINLNQAAYGQIRPDRSLPNNTQVRYLRQNRTIQIRGGTQTQRNLFHSLSAFNLKSGQTAIFQNSPVIRNVFVRVRGQQPSKILGTLRSRSQATIFLMNPAGLHFGSRMKLDIAGSLVATTARSIGFPDHLNFGQRQIDSRISLSGGSPIQLRFGKNPGSIQVASRTNFQPGRFGGLVNTGFSTTPQNSIALLGGDLIFNQGAVLVRGGHLELGGIGANQVVKVDAGDQTLQFDYRGISRFSDIILQNQAYLVSDAARSGRIHLQGKDLTILDGSRILASTQDQNGLPVRLDFSGDVALKDAFSLINTQTVGQGRGGDLILRANNLTIQDSAFINPRTLGTGASGSLEIDLTGMLMIRENAANSASDSVLRAGLYSGAGQSLDGTQGTGSTGKMTIRAQKIALEDGIIDIRPGQNGEIASTQLYADQLILDRGNIFLRGGDGKIHQTQITVNQLSLDQGRVSIETNNGEIDDIRIQSSDSIQVLGDRKTPNLQVRSSGRGGLPQLFIATPKFQVERGIISMNNLGTGSAGKIRLKTNQVDITQGGQLRTFNRSEGLGSSLDIASQERVLISGAGSEISTERFIRNAGNPGDLTIQTPLLLVNEQGAVKVQARAGNEINPGQQEGGNLNLLISDLLLLDSGAQLSTEVFSGNNSGNINFNLSGEPGYILAIPNTDSDIISRAAEGRGGNINIVAKAIFGLSESQESEFDVENNLDASSAINGLEGTVTVSTPDALRLSAEVAPPAFAGNRLNQACDRVSSTQPSQFINSGKGGTASTAQGTGDRVKFWEDLRLANRGIRSSRQDISRRAYDSQPRSFMEAEGFVRSPTGQVMLVAEAPTAQTRLHMATNPCLNARS